MSQIKKAVIAAAGFGTRFLPQTKAMPKEMLPIVDKPVIQYVVEELVEAGIKDIIIVTGSNKRPLEDHFDSPSQDLIENLRIGGKDEALEQVKAISELANFAYVRQKGPYGNGTPLMCARYYLGKEPFIYTWADDFFVASPSRFKQLIDTYNEHQCTVLAGLKATKDEDYKRYGFAAGKEISPSVIETSELIEKPGVDKAPSDVATVSGFVLTSEVFPYLERAEDNRQEDEELYYNSALSLMLKDGKKIVTKIIENGRYYDSGNKLEYLKTIVDFGLNNPEVGAEFGEYLKQIS